MTFIPYQRVATQRNTFAVVGDSRMIICSDLTQNKSNMWFNTANAVIGQKMRPIYQGAVSGNRSDQYLTTHLANAIASGAGWLVLFGVVNDISQSGSTGDTALTIWTRIKNASLQALAAGMNVIIVSETGATGLSAGSVVGMTYQYNQYAREFCEYYSGAYYFDMASTVIEPANATLAFRSGYSTDGTHLNPLGQWFAGNAFATFINPLLAVVPTQGFTANEINSNGGRQQVANPMFLTTTGGTSNTGITGNTPASFVTGRTGSAIATVSTGTDANGFGNAVTLACTFTAAGETIFFRQDTTLGNYTLGTDIVESGAHINVTAGSTVFAGSYLNTNFGGTANPTADLTPYSAGIALPNVAMDLTLKSVPFLIPGGATWATWEIRVIGSAAGTATVTVSRPWLRKRFS